MVVLELRKKCFQCDQHVCSFKVAGDGILLLFTFMMDLAFVYLVITVSSTQLLLNDEMNGMNGTGLFEWNLLYSITQI
jgi:hypothetical protein